MDQEGKKKKYLYSLPLCTRLSCPSGDYLALVSSSLAKISPLGDNDVFAFFLGESFVPSLNYFV